MRIIEVGPRDGLQNEKKPIETRYKLDFIRALANAGSQEIEATSFVSPKWVPQLGDAEDLWPQLPEGPSFSALVPNARGLERAVQVGAKRIALFTAASEAFTKKNINMGIDESLAIFADVAAEFRRQVPDGWIRGYVSTAFYCPYSGRVDVADVTRVAERLLDLGADEISIGDTVGEAVPSEVRELTKHLPIGKLAYHFHDTNGTGIANVAQALDQGVQAFDASAGGLGGCPYAPGAGGNLATEDLVYFLERNGVATGIDQLKLAEASLGVLALLGRAPTAKAQLASLARCETPPSAT